MDKPKEKYFSKSFDRPDERRPFAGHGHLDVLSLGPAVTIGKALFEPGWRWSNDVRPIAQTPSCDAEHYGICLTGSMTIRMDSGEEFTVKKGEAFYVAPGHDAWVVGNEAVEMLDFTGYKEYAKMKKAA